ncbi:Armadillo-type fold [Arabidopsis suecica]|uniref:Armadillo-type fold n=1 Tax=Arabidopsis suecica TaxID=45249 RepID=A0A8T2FE78_ARASU|nr:Armadillo-type fold [Arabidopsis suecica]
MRMVQLLFKFLIQVGATFVELSRNEIGNKNLLLLIHHAGSLLLSMFGSFSNYPVQKFLDMLDERCLTFIASEFDSYFENLVKDRVGNYVVQRLIWGFKRTSIDLPHSLTSVLVTRRIHLCKHRYGYQVIEAFDRSTRLA